MSLKIVNEKPGRSRTLQVALMGSLDSETAPQLEGHLDSVIDEYIATLIFDLRELVFISSAGLRVFVKSQKTLAARRGEVLMVHLQPQIQKVFDIVKALPSMTIFTSEQELDSYLKAMQTKTTGQHE